jgi:hypothetical protein
VKYLRTQKKPGGVPEFGLVCGRRINDRGAGVPIRDFRYFPHVWGGVCRSVSRSPCNPAPCPLSDERKHRPISSLVCPPSQYRLLIGLDEVLCLTHALSALALRVVRSSSRARARVLGVHKLPFYSVEKPARPILFHSFLQAPPSPASHVICRAHPCQQPHAHCQVVPRGFAWCLPLRSLGPFCRLTSSLIFLPVCRFMTTLYVWYIL